MRTCRSLIIAVAALLISAARRAGAQVDPDSVHHRDNCRLAAQVLATGNPAPKTAWADDYILSCGADVGLALARYLGRLRTGQDTTTLLPVLAQSSFVRDGTLFSGALAVARDPGASTPARVVALLTALTQVAPRAAFNTGRLFAPGTRVECPLQWNSSALPVAGGSTLPADAVTQVRSAASAVGSAGAPVALRRAGACARILADAGVTG